MKKKKYHYNLKIFILLFFLFILNFLLFSFVGNFFETNFTNKYGGSELKFISKAFIFSQTFDFHNAFNEGMKMPLYSIILSIYIYLFTPENLNFVQLINQFFTSSIILISFFIFKELKLTNTSSLILAFCISFYYPFHYYNNLYIVEPLSIPLSFLFIYFLLSKKFFFAAINIACLIYLKSHFILLLLPLLVSLLLSNYNLFKKIYYFLTCIFLICLILSPWSLFISKNYEKFIPTTVIGSFTIYHNLVYPPPHSIKYFNTQSKFATRELEYNAEKYINSKYINECVSFTSNQIILNKKFIYDNSFILNPKKNSCTNKYKEQTLFFINKINKELSNIIVYEKKYLIQNFIIKFFDSIGVFFTNFKDYISFSTFILFLISLFYIFNHNKKLFYLGFSYLLIHISFAFLINGGYIYRLTLSEPFYFLLISYFFYKTLFIQKNTS